MRLRITCALGCLLAAGTAGQSPKTLFISNVSVVDVATGATRVANVTIQGDTIVDVTAGSASPQDAVRIEGTGRFLIPGLWDMHVHLATRPEPRLAEEMMLPLFLAHGVVGVRDMGGPLERVLDLRSRVAGGSLAGPRILTPGPFVDGPGDTDPLFVRPSTTAAAREEVARLKRAGVDFIKVQSGLSPELHQAVSVASRDEGLPLAGHIPVAMTAEEVIASGQRTIEHLSPALVGDGLLLIACSSRSAELVADLRRIEAERATAKPEAIAEREWALRRQVIATYDPRRARQLGAAMKNRDVWIVPTLIWSASLRPLSRADDGAALPMDVVPAALRSRWLERRKNYITKAGDELIATSAQLSAVAQKAVRDLHNSGAMVVAGTDAFDAFVLPGDSLHRELRLLVEAGLRPLEALRTATSTAAAARGTAASEGSIAAGRRADLVLLDANPLQDIENARKVNTTIVGGVPYGRDALNAMLEGVRRFASQ